MVDTELLTVEEVASKIKATPTTVRRWLHSGKLRGVRLGGTKLGWRIPTSEVTRLLASQGLSQTRES